MFVKIFLAMFVLKSLMLLSLQIGLIALLVYFHRTISINGHTVCVNAGYEIELAISNWLINPCPLSKD